MYLKHIDIIGFKNLAELKADFSSKINCLTGLNGAGKTNLLDAIYYLSFTKSFFTNNEHENINRDGSFLMINGFYSKNGETENIFCGLKKGDKKQFLRNKKEYRRLSEHIGLFPLVMVSPYDSNLISSGSEERRKFINGVISQYDKNYLNDLINYNRILKQRNALLKEIRKHDRELYGTLEAYNNKLVQLGVPLFNKRDEFTGNIRETFRKFYALISGNMENVDIVYQSQLSGNDFGNLLEQSVNRDIELQYTTAGIHKDDLLFQIDGYPVKLNGSQGQQKTFLLSLKLAQFDFIKAKISVTPLLLLDDIFDKLDETRVSKLIKLAGDGFFGQVFISDTESERVERLLSEINREYLIFALNKGEIHETGKHTYAG